MQIVKRMKEEWNLPSLIRPENLAIQSSDYGYFYSESYILAFNIIRRFGIKILRFTLGPISSDNIQKKETENQFLNRVVKFIKENKIADLISCPPPTGLFSSYPDKSEHCSFGSYIIDLSLNEEELFSKLHTKHRNVIRKAEKDGIIISNDHQYKEQCISLINETLIRQNMSLPSKTYLATIKDSADFDFWVALKDDEIQGAAILSWTPGRSSYYLYGGSLVNPYTGSINFLHWSAIKLMKKRGVKYYDFVGARISPEPGSKLEGIQRFKSRFGSDFKEGYLWKVKINRFKSELYYSLIRLYGLIYHKNIKDIIDQENERN